MTLKEKLYHKIIEETMDVNNIMVTFFNIDEVGRFATITRSDRLEEICIEGKEIMHETEENYVHITPADMFDIIERWKNND